MTPHSTDSLSESLTKSGADKNEISPTAPAENSDSSSAIKCDAPIEQVLKWIVDGQADGDILEAIAKLWPDKHPQELYELAIDQVADAAKIEKGVLIGWCLMARRELYRRMLEIGDFAGALRATEKIESLAEKLG